MIYGSMSPGSGPKRRTLRELRGSSVTTWVGKAKGQMIGKKLEKEERLNWAN